MAFIEERLLEKVAYGTQAGIEYRTDVKALRSGNESRSRLWSLPLARFNVIFNVLKPEDRADVVRAFRAAGGRHLGFRMRDPLDHTAEDMPLGTATGAVQEIQLTKTYQFGPIKEVAPIFKPVGVVVRTADGARVEASTNTATGIVTLLAPAGTELLWSGVFDKPVRFDDDQLMWSVEARIPGGDRVASTDISLTEIRDIA